MPSEAKRTAKENAFSARMSDVLKPHLSNAGVGLESVYVMGYRDGEKKGRGAFDALYDLDVLDTLSAVSDALIQHGEARLDEDVRKIINAIQESL